MPCPSDAATRTTFKRALVGAQYAPFRRREEVVLKQSWREVSLVFLTTKPNGREMRHLGRFLYELLDKELRERASPSSICLAQRETGAAHPSLEGRELIKTWIIAGTQRQAGLYHTF